MPCKTGENRICEACGKQYYVSGWRLKKGNSRFCSLDCLNKKQYLGNTHDFECVTCGKKCQFPPSRRKTRKKYCSRQCKDVTAISRKECSRDAMRKNRLKKNHISSSALRKTVFSIKNCECEICGYNEYDFCIDLHHIDKDPSNNEIENIAVLCCICHKKFHKGIFSLSESNRSEVIKRLWPNSFPDEF
jgi:hypothetical protein